MQEYERKSGLQWLREHYQKVLADYERAKDLGIFIPPENFYSGYGDDAFQALLTHVCGKTLLEVGCGPAGCIPMWSAHVGNRILLDPLLDEYRTEVAHLVGGWRSWFTMDILYHAVQAEWHVSGLHEVVDGMILCRNTLDHCDEPTKVLDNLSEYAAAGCWLLLWTDLYKPGRDHVLKGTNGIAADEGHRNITKSRDDFERELKARGWRIARTFTMRQPPDVDWGGIAVME